MDYRRYIAAAQEVQWRNYGPKRQFWNAIVGKFDITIEMEPPEDGVYYVHIQSTSSSVNYDNEEFRNIYFRSLKEAKAAALKMVKKLSRRSGTGADVLNAAIALKETCEDVISAARRSNRGELRELVDRLSLDVTALKAEMKKAIR